jgi:bifunctional N-acetylglucosamine-1-phosphate-uridyltransferase/glucosamine-1-phosphate-acetyltransferase GlmU-like protein
MKIVLTLSGNSERFTSQGYPIKPLIRVHGKRLLEYALDMYPTVADSDFIFVVKSSDMSTHGIDRVIGEYKTSKVLAIPPNNLGPVFSISHIFDQIPDDEEVVVSYCDLTQKWDFDAFLKYCRDTNSDGCVVTHVGFHPHKLYNKSFAFLSVDGDIVKHIHEKKPMHEVKHDEPASNGIYYFKSGALLKKYFKRLMSEKLSVDGEYYVTVPYNLMINDGLKVTHYTTDNYVCLGTPADVICFESWLNIIKHQNMVSSDAQSIYKYWQRWQKHKE